MPITLTKTYPRLWTLEAGIAMIVTDLHGDWDAYSRYRDRFIALRTQGRVARKPQRALFFIIFTTSEYWTN